MLHMMLVWVTAPSATLQPSWQKHTIAMTITLQNGQGISAVHKCKRATISAQTHTKEDHSHHMIRHFVIWYCKNVICINVHKQTGFGFVCLPNTIGAALGNIRLMPTLRLHFFDKCNRYQHVAESRLMYNCLRMHLHNNKKQKCCRDTKFTCCHEEWRLWSLHC